MPLLLLPYACVQGKDVAIKKLECLGPTRAQEDFIREATIMVRCREHPNIAHVHGGFVSRVRASGPVFRAKVVGCRV